MNLNTKIFLNFRLVYLVSIRGKELTVQLENKNKEVQELLNEKKKNINKLLKEYDRCEALMCFFAEEDNNLELLYSKNTIKNHLSRINNTKAEVPNPKIPVKVQLIVENLNVLRNRKL